MASFFSRTKSQHNVLPLLNEQAEHLVRAAKVLAKMVAADSKTRTDMNTQLHEIENSADEASHRVMQEVGSRFALPFDRADLLSLSCRIDDCVDAIDEAGDNLVLYRIGPVPAGVYEIADILIECAEHAVHAIKKLKKSDPALRTEWLQIHNLENRADGIYRELIIELFSSDPTPKALLTSKIALDSFEAAVDAFEQLAVAIELLTLKES